MTIDLKIGADPELFLSKNGMFVSAHDNFPGTKREPFKLEKGAVQVDGTALEFNIEPASNALEFNANIDIVLKQLNAMVKKVDPELQLNFRPLVQYELNYFKSIPAHAKELGCTPDYNLGGTMNRIPEWQASQNVRTGSGHIHIGFMGKEEADINDPVHMEDCRFLAEYFHKSPGIPINAEDRNRLSYYGANGAHRPKPYGVELRQYSNRWVQQPNLRIQLFNHIYNHTKKLYQDPTKI